jgi:hypothetical protein
MRSAFLLLVLGLAFLVAGGSGSAAPVTAAAGGGATPFETLAGWALEFKTSPPANTKVASCARRWNWSGNAFARRQTTGGPGKLRGAFVRVGAKDDYWSASGRCLIYVVAQLARGVQANVYVETEPGVFTRAGYASHQRIPVESPIGRGGMISIH